MLSSKTNLVIRFLPLYKQRYFDYLRFLEAVRFLAVPALDAVGFLAVVGLLAGAGFMNLTSLFIVILSARICSSRHG